MSANPIPFENAGGQLAPINRDEPPSRLAEERQEERVNAPRLEKFINKTLDAIASLDQSENLKIHNSMVRCVAYYDGRWDGEIKNGVWVDNPSVDGEIQPKDNEYKKQIDKLHMEMCRGRIEYKAEAKNKSSAAMREAAEFATRRIEDAQDRIETEPFIQAENMSLLLKTIVLRYTFFDKNMEGEERSLEMKVMRQMTEGMKMLVCRTCGASEGRLPGEREEQPLPERESQIEPAIVDKQLDDIATTDAAIGTPCVRCGDRVKKAIIAPPSEGLQIEYEEKPSGAAVSVRPDASMVQLDLNARDIPSSSFLRWRLVLRRCDWEAMFPNTRIPSSDESQESRHRTQAQNNPSNSTWGESDSDTGGDQFEKIEGELVWLDPKVYQRYRNREAEQLKGGVILPADAPLIENYPEGACVARINKTILDMYPSNKNECWVMCVYGLREHALHGSGTLALLGPQDTINDENAFIVAHSFYRAAGREFIRDGGVQGGDLAPMGQATVITNAPEEVSDAMDWAYGRSQPEALSSDVYGFREAMRGSIQDHAGTSSLSMQGAADAKQLGTATGVEASRDQAVGRMIPNRKLQAHMGTEWAKQVLELERKNYTAETFLKLAGKANEKGEVEYTERGVKTFFQSKASDFVIKSVEGSWTPKAPYQEKADATEFGTIASQLSQAPNGPEILSLIAPKFGMDYDINEWGAAQRSASMRLEEYARAVKMLGNIPPSEEAALLALSNCAEWAQPNSEMDDHKAYMDFLSDWWTSDEGRNASPQLRLLVQTVHNIHRKGGVMDMATQTKEVQDAQAAITPPPDPSQDVAVALGEHQLDKDKAEHQAQLDMTKEQQKADNQLALKQEDMAHQAGMEAMRQPTQ